MTAFAYVLAGLHVAFLLFLWMAGSKKNGIKCAAIGLTALYFVAGSAPQMVPYLFVLEAVVIVRLGLYDAFKTAGSSLTRHTRNVFSYSVGGSIFSTLLAAALCCCLLRLDLAVYAFYAWPAFFAVEFILRQIKSVRMKAYLNKFPK